jgi:iron complex transport system substrate-binding protein
MATMRIVSLLPSATEIVCTLGLRDALAGVTFECDFPPDVGAVPAVSHPAVPFEDAATPADIDRLIAERVGAGRPVYRIDAERIAEIQPDLILTQDLCAVCAVPSGQVDDALARLGCRARVLSLDPHSLEAVLDSIMDVGRATGSEHRALHVVADLRRRLEAVRARVTNLARPRTVVLEWPDPPFGSGHWVPDMVEAAGGLEVVGRAGMDSVRVTWDDIRAAAPAVVVHAPCGYRLAEAQRLGAELPDLPGAALYATDANHLFSRPGPRLVDGVEALAWILHPASVDGPPPGQVARLR